MTQRISLFDRDEALLDLMTEYHTIYSDQFNGRSDFVFISGDKLAIDVEGEDVWVKADNQYNGNWFALGSTPDFSSSVPEVFGVDELNLVKKTHLEWAQQDLNAIEAVIRRDYAPDEIGLLDDNELNFEVVNSLNDFFSFDNTLMSLEISESGDLICIKTDGSVEDISVAYSRDGELWSVALDEEMIHEGNMLLKSSVVEVKDVLGLFQTQEKFDDPDDSALQI